MAAGFCGAVVGVCGTTRCYDRMVWWGGHGGARPVHAVAALMTPDLICGCTKTSKGSLALSVFSQDYVAESLVQLILIGSKG